MDITSAIAAASIYLHQYQTRESVGIAIAKTILDDQETSAGDLVESLQETAPPSEFQLDIKV